MTKKYTSTNNCSNKSSGDPQPDSMNRSIDLTNLLTQLTHQNVLAEDCFQLDNISLLISQPNNDNKSNKDDKRFSFLCANPTQQRLLTSQDEINIWADSLSELKEFPIKNSPLEPDNNPRNEVSHIPFHSGWVGYFAYPALKHPMTAEFNYYPWAISLDHKTESFYLLGQPDDAANKAFDWLLKAQKDPSSINTTEPPSFNTALFAPKWNKADYRKAFLKVQNYLLAGDCYQINLTQPFICSNYSGSATATLQPLFNSLKPSFGCYFKGQECELVSVSPERFISIDNKSKLEAKPIKGTIKRSDDSAHDNQLIEELTNSEKNRAENLMIVDLLRNDLSMSAIPGSVQVDKLFELESHPNVHHLVSTISAQLKPNISHAEAISNAFPGGSITGAPKKRAMEIIEELEVQPRSLYCGSFGYFSDSGHTDFNILIRSLEFRNNTITCWGGGGITIDSECDDEYEESITKIQRIMDVVESI